MADNSVLSHQNEQPKEMADADHSPFRSLLRLLILFFCALIMLLLVFSVWAWCSFGSLTLGYAYLQGYRVYPAQREILLADVSLGETVKMSFDLKNLTGNGIQILGAKPDCGCITTSQFPVTLKANGMQTLSFEFHADKVGKNQHVIVAYFDTNNPPLALVAKVNVIKK